PLDTARDPEPTTHDGPGIPEDELYVEDHEENRGEVELGRESADRQRERDLSALERLRFHARRLLRAEHGSEEDVRSGERRGQDKSDHDAHVFDHWSD